MTINGHIESERKNFSEYLRAACARHKSISTICRDIGINRQQFNKYLSGASFPSPFNLETICRHLDLDRDTFRKKGAGVGGQFARAPSLPSSLGPIAQYMHSANPDASRKLERYSGFYHSYYCSPAYPGKIIKSVSCISKKGDFFFDRTIERLVDPSRPDSSSNRRNKYTGIVIHTDDRLYVIHQNLALHQTLSMHAFYPSFAPKLRLLSGVFVTVSSGPGRQPFAGKVVYEYHGESPNVRAMVRACGLYTVGAGDIKGDILTRLENHSDSNESVLRAPEY